MLPLVGPPALRRAILPRLPAPLVVRPPLRRLQPRPRRLDRRPPILPPPQLRRQLVPANLLPKPPILLLIHARRRRRQRLNLLTQPRLLPKHPVVTHRLPLARVRTNLRPVDRKRPQANQPHLPRQPNHLQKQGMKVRQMTPPELADRPMVRKVPRRQHPKRNVFLQLPRQLPRRKHPRRIPVDQHLHHHHRRIRRVPTTVPLIRRVKRQKVQIVHHLAHLVRQVPLGNPVVQLHRHQQLLIRLIRSKPRRHPPPPQSSPETRPTINHTISKTYTEMTLQTTPALPTAQHAVAHRRRTSYSADS